MGHDLSAGGATEGSLIAELIAEAFGPDGGALSKEDERAAALREADDPERALWEIFGLTLTPDQRIAVHSAHDESLALWLGGNGLGKSLVAIAYALAWHWEALGRKRVRGRRQGCILIIPAPSATAGFDASYRKALELGQRALDRGWEIMGYTSASHKDVLWCGEHSAWYMAQANPPRVATSSRDQVSHAASGHHHDNLVAVIEEAKGIGGALLAAVLGWLSGSQNLAVACMNPTSQDGAIYAQREAWATTSLSALRHPDVVERREVIGGGSMSHVKLEQRLRDWPGYAVPVGRYPETQPDPGRLDFVYALPPRDMPDKLGPRPDGIPGHPDAEPWVYRPSPYCCGQVLGVWPVESAGQPFPESLLEAAAEAWAKADIPRERHEIIMRPPDAVGVDAARTGDRIVATPRWGPAAYDAILAGRDHPRDPPRCVLGEPVNVPPTGGGVYVTAHLISLWGKAPVYLVDSGGGSSIIDSLRREGCRVVEVPFGGGPTHPPAPGQPRALNRRAEMYVDLSAGLAAHQVALCLHGVASTVRRELQASTFEEAVVQRRHEGGAMPAVKVRDKEEIAGEIGLSPDVADSYVLAASRPAGSWVVA